jgi:hypothetical protein
MEIGLEVCSLKLIALKQQLLNNQTREDEFPRGIQELTNPFIPACGHRGFM